MGKESLVYRTELNLKALSELGFKLLFTTHNFRLLGIVTWDNKLLDESLGVRRRWIKGLKMENGVPIPAEDRIFETSLHRKSPMSGQLEDLVVHEDDFMILMERKTFDLSDEDGNFQFMPNMHYMNRVQQLVDEIEEGNRRIARLMDEKEEAVLDSEHFRREATAAKEREKTQSELINRLTRENANMQTRLGNLESAYQLARAKNMTYEAEMDERTANAAEEGTLRGMTTDDLLIYAAEKKRQLYEAMHEIEPETAGDSDQIQGLVREVDAVKEELSRRGEETARPEGAKRQ